MEQPNGNGAVPAQAVVHELIIRWVPSTGSVQVGSTPMDAVAQLGLLEMAKVALAEQRAAAARGEGPRLVVPGRFNP